MAGPSKPSGDHLAVRGMESSDQAPPLDVSMLLLQDVPVASALSSPMLVTASRLLLSSVPQEGHYRCM